MSNSNNKASYWKPSAEAENDKLSLSGGFKLAGSSSNVLTSRTRGATRSYRSVAANNTSLSPLPTPKRPRVLFCGNSLNSTISSLTPLSSVPGKSRSVPEPTRVLLELNPLKKQMESLIHCPLCSPSVIVTFPTTAIASGCKVTCSDVVCSFISNNGPSLANVPQPATHQGSALIKRIVDYEANVLYVLSFLVCGDGGVEAGRLLGLMGLNNATTMGPRSFGIVEEYIGPVIQQYADKIIQQNITEEVHLFYGNKKNDDGILYFNLWQDGNLPDDNHDSWPQLIGTYDMAWQGRASGSQYNSVTGDGLVFGALTRKAIAYAVISKGCSFCNGWRKSRKQDMPIPDHDCRKNWNGSSGAMEPYAMLKMYRSLYTETKVVLSWIVTDDDSSIKSKMKWSNADHMILHGLNRPPTVINSNGKEVVRIDHGEVPRHMPEPGFYADPNHRKKTWKKTLYQLLLSNASKRMAISHMDVLRLGTNFAHMVRTVPGKSDEDMMICAKAVIQHHFDCHDYCGDWCSRNKQTQQQQETLKKYYRCKIKDAELYKELQSRIARFITFEALSEVRHGYDTLCNESFNNVAAWIAPKNKVYGSSNSLKTRICVAIGLVSCGTLLWYRGIFQRLGLTMRPDTEHYIRLQTQYRVTRLAKQKTAEGKKKRVDRYHKNLLTKTVLAKREKAKREGTYKTAIRIDGGYTEAELATAKTLYPRDYARTKQQADRHSKKKECPRCQRVGHTTWRSKSCGMHQAYLDSRKAAPAQDSQSDANNKQDNSQDAAVDGDVATAGDQNDDDVHTGEDTSLAQTARDAGKCDILDSFALDGTDEFYDSDTFSDDKDDSNFNDKENMF